MKKIYINRTKRFLAFGDVMLQPGSNVAAEIDESKFPTLKALMEDGDVEISEDPTSAVNQANTQKAVDDILNTAPNNDVAKKAGSKRKKELDDLDELAKAAAKNGKNKKDGEEGSEEEADGDAAEGNE